MFFYFSITLGQSDLKPPAFLDPKIDTVAFVNCSQGTLDTIISYARKNPKFIIDNNVSCSVKIVFFIEKNFMIYTNATNDDDITMNLVLRNKVSKKYSDKIRRYYSDQTKLIARNLDGLFIPDRVNGEYYKTIFYLNIDFTKGEDGPAVDSLKSKVFQVDDLSNQSIEKNKKLREKGIQMLKNKKPQLGLIYFNMAYYVNNDVESAILLGNLWDVMGESKIACHYWKKATELGNKQAESLIKKCIN